MLLGWLVLALLTVLAALAALGIAARAKLSGRAEMAVVSLAVFFALLGAPVLVLGYANHLTATTLGLTSLLVSGAVLYVPARGLGLRRHLRDCVDAARSLASAPFAALREAARARSLVLLGLLWTGVLLALSLLCIAVVPYTSWDGYIYHEAIVGYAIQNHGFAMVDLPPLNAVQSTNGFPKVCEAVTLFFVVFTDRTLVELPDTIAAVGLIACTYAMARRYVDRVTAMGLACVLFLMPATWSQLSSSYIDIEMSFFMLAAIHHATRPAYRFRDFAFATLAMALALEARPTALAWVPPIALVATGRLVFHHVREHRAATLAAIAGGAGFLAALPLHYCLRNWVAFQDPFWPVTVDIPRLGVHWTGLATLGEKLTEPPLSSTLSTIFDVPVAGLRDIHDRGYGYGVVWVILPAALVAVPLVLASAGAETLGLKAPGSAANLLWVLLPAAVGLSTTPSLSTSRYNIHFVAALLCAAAWLVSPRTWTRAREALVASALVLSIMPFFWLRSWVWSWGATEDMGHVLAHPFSSPHAYLDKPAFDLLARQRFEEIHAGDRVAYDEGEAFPGALWNFDYSNHVAYIPFTTKEAYLARIEQYGPKWVVVGGAAARSALEGSGRWEVIGRFLNTDDAVALRRR